MNVLLNNCQQKYATVTLGWHDSNDMTQMQIMFVITFHVQSHLHYSIVNIIFTLFQYSTLDSCYFNS